jgi:RNA polymerase sigma-70 factor (ECF subfamily)
VVVDPEAVEGCEPATPVSDSPEAQLLREVMSRDLRAALESLPPALGRVVWLRDIEGLSYAEIARRLDIPIGTVMSRLSRARERLYSRLTGRPGAFRQR